MKYLEVTFTTHPCNETVNDVVSALAGEIGFESFVECEAGVQAYIQQTLFDEEALKEMIASFPLPDTTVKYTIKEAEDKNWNEEWEKNYFKPIVVGDECVIHSTFHTDIPQARYDVLIDPKMAFGTGHHETTTLMLQAILASDLTGRSVLDMGSGTAVLGILARMKGAASVVAVDIDEFAVENAIENIRLNHVSGVEVRLGGIEALKRESFDFIFANINRNILLADMHAYVACMKRGSRIFMSGFYVEDIPFIRAEAEHLGLRFVGYAEKNRWVAVECMSD